MHKFNRYVHFQPGVHKMSNQRKTCFSYNKHTVHIDTKYVHYASSVHIWQNMCPVCTLCTMCTPCAHHVHTPCAHSEHQVFRVAAQERSCVLVFPLYPSSACSLHKRIDKRNTQTYFWSKGVPLPVYIRCAQCTVCTGMHTVCTAQFADVP